MTVGAVTSLDTVVVVEMEVTSEVVVDVVDVVVDVELVVVDAGCVVAVTSAIVVVVALAGEEDLYLNQSVTIIIVTKHPAITYIRLMASGSPDCSTLPCGRVTANGVSRSRSFRMTCIPIVSALRSHGTNRRPCGLI